MLHLHRNQKTELIMSGFLNVFVTWRTGVSGDGPSADIGVIFPQRSPQAPV